MMNSRPTRKPDAPRGPFKELRRGVSKILSSRAFLVTVSLFAAVFFWSALVASDGTLTRQKTFANVSVNVSGEAALKARGYIVMDDVSELLPGVRMTVEVTQANYNRASGTSYNPHIDLTKITGEGQNEIPVSFSSQLYGPVISCEPASVTLNVERYITRRIPVVLETLGEVEGYYLDSAKTDPSMLSVSGPQSLISKVARAVATFDASLLSGERMSDRISADVKLMSAAGDIIESDLIEITNQTVITRSVVVETELMPVKDLPLQLDEFVTGTPQKGYELYDIVAAQDTVRIAAKQDLLDAMTVITTDSPMNIEGVTEDVSGYVRLRRPSGIENNPPYEIAVTAKIRETEIEKTLRKIPVEVDGLDDALQARLSRSSQTVQLTGPYSFISELEASDIRLFVDVNYLEPGRHDVPVQISIDNAPEFGCALSSPTLEVTITER